MSFTTEQTTQQTPGRETPGRETPGRETTKNQSSGHVENIQEYFKRDGDVITRLFYNNDFNEKTTGTPRYRAIVYRYNLKTGETWFGASVWRPSGNETTLHNLKETKTHLRDTAFHRLQKAPVHGFLPTGIDRTTCHQQLVKALFKNGARSHDNDEVQFDFRDQETAQ